MTETTDRPKRQRGFFMPAEFEPHAGCIMIWPVRPGSWIESGRYAKKTFCKIADAIAADEKLYMLADENPLSVQELAAGEYDTSVTNHFLEAESMLKACRNQENIEVLSVESDDAWARDVAPTFVYGKDGALCGIDWSFNAWGGSFDGLYREWDQDDAVAEAVCERLHIPSVKAMAVSDHRRFVLEGGSVHTDGEGTILTTEACLLSPGRNPGLSREEIEQTLCYYLGGEKVIWLPHGIYGDETNEHVDNMCAFVSPGRVVLAWTEDETDPQYAFSKEAYAVLSKERDAKGRRFEVIRLPVPKKPVCITGQECRGFVFAEGEEIRKPGERLATSYVNFYISNRSVLVPQFGDVHDALAVEILGRAFPGRKIVPVAARDIIVGGGNIHCITQQIPG